MTGSFSESPAVTRERAFVAAPPLAEATARRKSRREGTRVRAGSWGSVPYPVCCGEIVVLKVVVVVVMYAVCCVCGFSSLCYIWVRPDTGLRDRLESI